MTPSAEEIKAKRNYNFTEEKLPGAGQSYPTAQESEDLSWKFVRYRRFQRRPDNAKAGQTIRHPESLHDSAPGRDLLGSPSFFPFRLKPVHAENLVAASSRLDLLRHGLDDDLVMLRKQTTKGGAP
ncbi:MAG: hypothetical protein GXY71_01595 [Treponema sp.]|nr:hypothetical protein [Treponema sp.]